MARKKLTRKPNATVRVDILLISWDGKLHFPKRVNLRIHLPREALRSKSYYFCPQVAVQSPKPIKRRKKK